jgi:transcriptional regulator with XRE-family HTH domain
MRCMPVDYRAPNINARRLGHYLQQVREALDLSYDAAAAVVGCDATWLIRLETGFQQVTPEEIRWLLDRYDIPEHPLRTAILDLASRPAGPPWLAAHVGRMKALVRDLLTLESEASVVRTYGIQLIPELVRTEAYARMCFASAYPEVDADQEWDLLSHRQRHRPGGRPRFLDVIVDESTLTMPAPESGVMRDQLRHLLELARDPAHATVRVIPMAVGAHAGLGGAFDVLEFPGTAERISTVHGALGIDIAATDLTDTWRMLEDVALTCEESREMLVRIVPTHPPRATSR